MSRSYKKHAYSGDHKGKEKKRIANSVVRMWLKDHPDEVIKRSNYKKLYEKYDICDYKDFAFWETYCLSCLRWSDTDYKRAYQKWLQFYRNK